MPCDTKARQGQSLSQRKAEVRTAVEQIAKLLVSGSVKARVGPQGAIAFEGITTAVRNDVTDACVYRQIMLTGSAAAKLAIQRAEQLAGRQVDRAVIGQGVHSHDGGVSWHRGH
jgi:hypothetical protein